MTIPTAIVMPCQASVIGPSSIVGSIPISMTDSGGHRLQRLPDVQPEPVERLLNLNVEAEELPRQD